jgi:hypothetical protein
VSEEDGFVAEREDVSLDGFRPKHAAGFFNGLGEWCFGKKEAGGNT